MINGGLQPGINLSKMMGQLINVSADLNADRKDIHEVTVFLTPPGQPPPTGAQEVIIRQLPALRVRGRMVEQAPVLSLADTRRNADGPADRTLRDGVQP